MTGGNKSTTSAFVCPLVLTLLCRCSVRRAAFAILSDIVLSLRQWEENKQETTQRRQRVREREVDLLIGRISLAVLFHFPHSEWIRQSL